MAPSKKRKRQDDDEIEITQRMTPPPSKKQATQTLRSDANQPPPVNRTSRDGIFLRKRFLRNRPAVTKQPSASKPPQPADDLSTPAVLANVHPTSLTCDQDDKDDSHTQKHNLLSLPHELQDIIFDYAYPKIEGFRAITRANWEHRQKHSSRRSDGVHSARPFPTPLVSNWIVSRKYLLTAAQVFIGNQLFDYADIASSSYFTDAQHGLVAQFVTSMKLADHDIMLLNYAQLPSLQSVTLLFGGDILDDLEDVDPWKDDLEKKHLEIVAKSKHLLRLSGLQEFHIQLTDTMHLIDEPNASQKAKLSENMQKLEVFLPPLALRSKTQNDPHHRLKRIYRSIADAQEPPPTNAFVPLYLGSKVRLESQPCQETAGSPMNSSIDTSNSHQSWEDVGAEEEEVITEPSTRSSSPVYRPSLRDRWLFDDAAVTPDLLQEQTRLIEQSRQALIDRETSDNMVQPDWSRMAATPYSVYTVPTPYGGASPHPSGMSIYPYGNYGPSVPYPAGLPPMFVPPLGQTYGYGNHIDNRPPLRLSDLPRDSHSFTNMVMMDAPWILDCINRLKDMM